MNHIIEMLSEEADMVIFDTPPTLTVADAAILAPQTSGCLLVVNIGETRQHALAQAADRLRSTGANLFGAVMNQLKVGRSGYYYGYYRYYDYEYSQSGSRRRNPFRLPAWLSALGRRS
jgi:Mrp family chromosome partitioning ATPase